MDVYLLISQTSLLYLIFLVLKLQDLDHKTKC